MAVKPYFPSNRDVRWIRMIPALTAVFVLLVARHVPPEFPKTPSHHHSAVSAISKHDQRPRFDSVGSQWSTPVRGFLPFPPSAEATHAAPASQLWSALQTKGYHYNRPPPAS